MLVLITSALKMFLKANANVSSRARGLDVGQRLHLPPYFMYAHRKALVNLRMPYVKLFPLASYLKRTKAFQRNFS